MKLFSKLSLLTSCLLASQFASADIRINGFANLNAGVTSEDTNLFGYDQDINFKDTSLFAVQISGDINDRTTATAQILARGSDDYSANLEWAYLSYEVNDNWSMSAGRLRLPVFRYSSSLDVGYSYHWISAPSAVYDVSFNNVEGIRLDYGSFVGDWEIVSQFSYGAYDNEVSGGRVDATNVILASLETTLEAFKARVVYGRGTNTFSQEAIDQAVAGIAQVSPALADGFAIDEDKGEFLGFGLEYDNFDWFISGEYTTIATEESFSPEDVAYYVTAGIRAGQWTPHITYQHRDGNDDLKFVEQVNALPAPVQAAIAPIVLGLQQRFYEDYTVLTIGTRYDIDTNLALKAEISKYDDKLDGAGIRSSLDSNLVNVSVNYIF